MYLESKKVIIQDNLILNSKKQKNIFPVVDNHVYCFVYKDVKGKKQIEIIDMIQYLSESELSDIQKVIGVYKTFLLRFNSTLKPGETKRIYLTTYKIDQQVILTKIKEINVK